MASATVKQWRGPSAAAIALANGRQIATDEQIIEYIIQQFQLHNNLYAVIYFNRLNNINLVIHTNNEGPIWEAELERFEEIIPYVVETTFDCPYVVVCGVGHTCIQISLIKNSNGYLLK